jgi:hypothetical protein
MIARKGLDSCAIDRLKSNEIYYKCPRHTTREFSQDFPKTTDNVWRIRPHPRKK